MYRPGLSELEAVLAISRLKSFRAAALELGLSPTALSNLIIKLERQLGVRLFNRTTRSVGFTEAGQVFVDQIAPAVHDIRRAVETASSQRHTLSGTLRINAYATGAREIFDPLVVEFVHRHPQVHVDIVTEERLVDIVAAGFDFGLRRASLVPRDMIAVPLGPRQRYAVVASPDYLERHAAPVIPADLERHTCVRVRLPNGALYRWEFARAGQLLKIDVNGPVTLDEPGLARTAVLASLGLGFFMEADVRDDIATGRLIRVLEDWTPPLEPLCLYYSDRRHHTAALQAFLDLTRQWATCDRSFKAPCRTGS